MGQGEKITFLRHALVNIPTHRFFFTLINVSWSNGIVIPSSLMLSNQRSLTKKSGVELTRYCLLVISQRFDNSYSYIFSNLPLFSIARSHYDSVSSWREVGHHGTAAGDLASLLRPSLWVRGQGGSTRGLRVTGVAYGGLFNLPGLFSSSLSFCSIFFVFHRDFDQCCLFVLFCQRL